MISNNAFATAYKYYTLRRCVIPSGGGRAGKSALIQWKACQTARPTEALGEVGELLLALTGWVARMESQRRSERTKAGLARVVAQGKKLGRPLGSKDKRRRKKRSPKLPIWEL